MGVNRREDAQISVQEAKWLETNGETYGTSHARESLRALCHIPYYANKFVEFIEKHGERSV